MNRAFQVAKKANICDTLSNPLVGAVIVKRGVIISEGYYKKYGGEHAEVVAIKKTRGEAKGAVLYCTLEPCTGTWAGKKRAPCVEQIIQSGIKTVYIASLDVNKRISGKGVRDLQKAGINVNILSQYKKSENVMNEAFIALHRKKHTSPFVHLKIAQSLDGRMASVKGDSKWITNKKSRDMVQSMRIHSNAICVGVHTICVDNPRYTIRNSIKRIINPSLVILDSKLTVPLDAQCFQYARRTIFGSKNGIVLCVSKKVSKRASKYSQFIKKRKILEKNGCYILELSELQVKDRNTKKIKLSLPHLMEDLVRNGVYSVLVETGPALTHSFLRDGLVDKVSIFIAPFFLGGDKVSTQDLHIFQMINKKKIYYFTIKTIYPKQVNESDTERNILVQGYMYDFFKEI